MKKRGVALFAVFATLAVGLVAGANASEPTVTTGGKIVYAGIDPVDGMSDIYVKSPSGSTATNITHSAGSRKDLSPSFSPAGTKIAFVRSTRTGAEIMVVNPDGSGLQDVTPASFRGATNLDPRWSGDGTRIVFTSNVDGNYDLYWIDAAVSSSTLGNAHRLTKTEAPVRNLDPAWTHNGKHVVFSRSGHRPSLSGPAAELFQLDVLSLQAARLTKTLGGRGDAAPVYSPDDRSIAFSSDRSGNQEVYVLSLVTKTLTNLTNNPASDTEPAFSPNGTAVAFVSTRKGATEIFSQNLAGLTPGPAAAVQLTFDGADKSHPDWGATATHPGPVGGPVETPLPSPTSGIASPTAASS
jgi:Tol biopolymer transport system component